MTIGSIWIIFIGVMVLSMIIQGTLQSRFRKYSKVALPSGMSGAEVAMKMLHDNGIYDVKVIPTNGMLTDHYNPVTKTVALSEGVYSSRSVAAAAVAAHECGHAVQHAVGYAPLKRTVDSAARHHNGKYIPDTSVDRHRSLCDDYSFQHHHTSGGSQCQHEGSVMARQCRHNRQHHTADGHRRFEMGCLHIRDCSHRVIGDSALLHRHCDGRTQRLRNQSRSITAKEYRRNPWKVRLPAVSETRKVSVTSPEASSARSALSGMLL